jgi:precorrin-6B methylase 2
MEEVMEAMEHKVDYFHGIPTFTRPGERRLLKNLAKKVPAGGTILEIGSLYGGITALLALSNPKAAVLTIDRFSWKPSDLPKPSKPQVEANMRKLGIRNVEIIEDDSHRIGPLWDREIELLWIDGGHSYESVFADLTNFHSLSKVIALHDYGNRKWASVRKAADDFRFVNQHWVVDQVVDTVAVLCQRKGDPNGC